MASYRLILYHSFPQWVPLEYFIYFDKTPAPFFVGINIRIVQLFFFNSLRRVDKKLNTNIILFELYVKYFVLP